MMVKLTTVEELKQIFVENLLNSTDKVTKISEGSVLNGVAYGVAKIAQKIIKDVALIEAHQYPDTATGKYLDLLAEIVPKTINIKRIISISLYDRKHPQDFVLPLSNPFDEISHSFPQSHSQCQILPLSEEPIKDLTTNFPNL